MALVARGHAVTVLARWRPGLPERRTARPAGYRIRRVKVSARRGLPLPRAVIDLRVGGTSARPAGRRSTIRGASGGRPSDPTPPAWRDRAEDPRRPLGASAARGPRLVADRRDRARRPLADEGHAAASPPTRTSYHGMAYMGIPVALSLARRGGAPVVYDARDIYVDAGNLARLPRPGSRDRRPPGARLGAARGPRRHGERPLRGGDGGALGGRACR